MKEKAPGKLGRFIEAIRSGGLSEIIQRKEPWTQTALYTQVSAEDDAAYIRVSRGEAVRTEPAQDGLHIDYDKDGDVVGIELLGYNIRRAAEKVPSQNQK